MAAVFVRDLTLADQVIRKVDGVSLQANSDDIALGAIRYNAAQSLTEAQKEQARANIGAGSGGSSGTFRGNFNTWETIPTEVSGFEGGAIKSGDYITIDDASTYYAEGDTTTLVLQRFTKNDKDSAGNYIINAIIRPYLEDGKYYLVQHLYIGQRVAQDVVYEGTTIAHSGDFLTETQVAAIGESTITSLVVYTSRSGKWILQYESESETYSKTNFKWLYKLNNDTDIYVQLDGVNEVVSGVIVDLQDEAKRAKDAEIDIAGAVAGVNAKVDAIKQLPDFSGITPLTSSDGIAVVRNKVNEILALLQS